MNRQWTPSPEAIRVRMTPPPRCPSSAPPQLMYRTLPASSPELSPVPSPPSSASWPSQLADWLNRSTPSTSPTRPFPPSSPLQEWGRLTPQHLRSEILAALPDLRVLNLQTPPSRKPSFPPLGSSSLPSSPPVQVRTLLSAFRVIMPREPINYAAGPTRHDQTVIAPEMSIKYAPYGTFCPFGTLSPLTVSSTYTPDSNYSMSWLCAAGRSPQGIQSTPTPSPSLGPCQSLSPRPVPQNLPVLNPVLDENRLPSPAPTSPPTLNILLGPPVAIQVLQDGRQQTAYV